jgi:hypothetical protein
LNFKFLNLKKGFSNLEPEGQGRRIIMVVTRLLLLGLFYTIQMQIYVLFCTRLYIPWCNLQLSILVLQVEHSLILARRKHGSQNKCSHGWSKHGLCKIFEHRPHLRQKHLEWRYKYKLSTPENPCKFFDTLILFRGSLLSQVIPSSLGRNISLGHRAFTVPWWDFTLSLLQLDAIILFFLCHKDN